MGNHKGFPTAGRVHSHPKGKANYIIDNLWLLISQNVATSFVNVNKHKRMRNNISDTFT